MYFLNILFAGFVGFGAFHFGSGTNSGEDGGSLLSIYNHLAILARITNAIALQSGSIQKNLNIRDVITELLKAHTESFTELIENDPDKLIPMVKYIADKGQEVFKDVKLGDLKDQIEQLVRAMSTDLPDEKTYETAIEDFKKSGFREHSLICDDKTVDLISDVYKIMNGSSKDTESVNIKKLRSEFREANSKKIRECLKSIQDHKSLKIPNTKFIYDLKNFRNNLTYFKKNAKIFMDFPLEISKIRDIFSKAKDIWTTRQPSGIYSTIMRIEQLLDVISDHEKEPKPNICAGFPGDDDLEKVTSDVKSEWFQKNIARGKSTAELEVALAPYEKVGRKLKKFRGSYEEFHEIFSHQNEFVHSMSGKIKNIEEYDGLETGMELIEKSLDVFKKSWTEITSDTVEFQPLHRFISKFLELKDTMQKWRDEALLSFDFETIHNILDEIQKLNLDTLVSLNDIKEEIRGIPHYDTLESLFENFQDLHSSQTFFLHNYKFWSDFTTDDVQTNELKEMKNSALLKNLERLQKNKFPGEEFGRLFQFLEDLREYKENYPKFATFFETYATMKKNLLTVESFIKKMGTIPSQIVVDFKNSLALSTQFGRGMRVYRDISYAYSLRREILESTDYDPEVNKMIIDGNPHQHVAQFWRKGPKKAMEKLIQELKNLDLKSKEFESRDLHTLHKALVMSIKVKGLQEFKQGYQDIAQQLEESILNDPNVSENFYDALGNSHVLRDLDLDFASRKGYLQAASLSIDDIALQFDEMFGLNNDAGKTVKHAYIAVVGITIGAIFLAIIAVLVIFGLTEKGKTKYKNLYLFYFGKPADFEKRWRYSLFMDRQDGKNALIDAVREINAMNVAKEAKRGAFINVYSLYGNTALHMATKRGYPEIVEILIKNGADRTLLNAQNKTPEQMIPDKYQETEKAGRYEQVEKIYQKYKNKKFRIRVPEVFPSSSFHIFIDDKLDLEVVNAFMLQHKSIVTPTLIPTTTHFIAKTDSDGACEVDSFETLFWILSGVIIVKETWITDCLKDPKLINKDSGYLVEKVKYKGTVYSTVTQWTEAMAKSTMPYLHGVYLAVVTTECSNLLHLTAVVNNHGGVVCETFPDKEQFNVGARPYLHSNLGPFFLIHDGKIDLEVYRNDPDKMYTLFTEEEFVHFLLKRGINVDVRPDPIPATTEPDD